jgi:hypothetical protein
MQKGEVRMQKLINRRSTTKLSLQRSRCDSFRRANGGDEDGSEFTGLSHEGSQFPRTHDLRFLEEFKPEDCFIGFLKDDSQLCNEFSSRPGATSRPIVSSYRSARAQKLSPNDSGILATRKRSVQPHNAQCKLLRSVFQIFNGIHEAIMSRLLG